MNILTSKALKKTFGMVQDAINSHTHESFTKSGSGAKGGFVPPPPSVEGSTKYLCEDGSWKIPPSLDTSGITPASIGAVPVAGASDKTGMLRVLSSGTDVNHPKIITVDSDNGTRMNISADSLEAITSDGAVGILKLNPEGAASPGYGEIQTGSPVRMYQKLMLRGGLNVNNCFMHHPEAEYQYIPVFNGYTDGDEGGNVGYKNMNDLIVGTAKQLMDPGNGAAVTAGKSGENASNAFPAGWSGYKIVPAHSLVVYGLPTDYPSLYSYSGLQIREANLDGEKDAADRSYDDKYSPRLSFHWGNRCAGSLALDKDGLFKLVRQDGQTRAQIDCIANYAIYDSTYGYSIADVANKVYNGTVHDSSLLGGFSVSESSVGDTVVKRSNGGYIYGHYFNQSSSVEDPPIGAFFVQNSNNDGFLRKASISKVQSTLGISSNSDTVDGFHASQTHGNLGNNTCVVRRGVYGYVDIGGVETGALRGFSIRIASDNNNPDQLNWGPWYAGSPAIAGLYYEQGATYTSSLGVPSRRWSTAYLSSSPSISSDENVKHDITSLDSDVTKSFIMKLNPISFKYNDGESGRTHFGLGARAVESVMEEVGLSGMDFAGLIKSPKVIKVDDDLEEDGTGHYETIEGEYEYMLRYEEFISPLIKMVQIQQNQIDQMQTTISDLQNQLQLLTK